MAFIVTRIDVGNYDMWKTMFDKDEPRARSTAKGHRIFRSRSLKGFQRGQRTLQMGDHRAWRCQLSALHCIKDGAQQRRWVLGESGSRGRRPGHWV
jgi:hypothetical protein